jgi:mannosyltransferase
MYTGITALALLSTILLLKACRGALTRHWLAYPAVTSLLFYTHILTPLFLPVQWILVLLLEGRAALSRKALIATGVLVLPYLPLLLWQWPHIVEPAETGFPFVPLPTMALRMGNAFSRGIIGRPAGIALALLLGAMALGLIPTPSECRRRKLRLGLGLLIWAALPIVELYLVSLRRPLFTERYLIWSLPGWLILAAGGLAWLARRGRVARLLALVWTAALVVIALIGIGRQWGTPVRADFRSATALVAEHYQVGDLIVFQIPYLQATFDYYAPELTYQGAEGPYTNWGNPADEIAAYMQAVTAGYPRIWLVLSESTMWDARNLTVEWFQDHARLQRTAVFNRVEVTEWQLDSGE